MAGSSISAPAEVDWKDAYQWRHTSPGCCFVLGGYSTSVAVEEYFNVESQTWHRIDNFAFPRRQAVGCMMSSSTAFVFGGQLLDNPSEPALSCHLLDLSEAASGIGVTNAAPLEKQSLLATCGVLDGKIYRLSGTEGAFGSPVRLILQYDPGTDQWTKSCKQQMFHARVYGASATLEQRGVIFTMGGYAGMDMNNCERFDPRESTPSAIAPLHIALCNAVCVPYNDSVYQFGGWNNQYLKQTVRYDPRADKWEKMGAEYELPVAVSGHRGGIDENDCVYLFGGHANEHQRAMMFNMRLREWTELPQSAGNHSESVVLVC